MTGTASPRDKHSKTVPYKAMVPRRIIAVPMLSANKSGGRNLAGEQVVVRPRERGPDRTRHGNCTNLLRERAIIPTNLLPGIRNFPGLLLCSRILRFVGNCAIAVQIKSRSGC